MAASAGARMQGCFCDEVEDRLTRRPRVVGRLALLRVRSCEMRLLMS